MGLGGGPGVQELVPARRGDRALAHRRDRTGRAAARPLLRPARLEPPQPAAVGRRPRPTRRDRAGGGPAAAVGADRSARPPVHPGPGDLSRDPGGGALGGGLPPAHRPVPGRRVPGGAGPTTGGAGHPRAGARRRARPALRRGPEAPNAPHRLLPAGGTPLGPRRPPRHALPAGGGGRRDPRARSVRVSLRSRDGRFRGGGPHRSHLGRDRPTADGWARARSAGTGKGSP